MSQSLILNTVFLTGYLCCVSAAFLVALPLGLVVVGAPMVAVSIYVQMKAVKNDS